MGPSKKRIVASVSVGEPSKTIQRDIETIEFIIYDFKDKTEKRNERIRSPPVTAHGLEWEIWVYPKGCSGSPKGTEYVSFYLYSIGRLPVTTELMFRCKRSSSRHTFPATAESGALCGCPDFRERKLVIANHLEEDDSLVIKCDVQISTESRRIWYPKDLVQQDILSELYQDGASETSDVVFLVGEKMYTVHKCILSLRAKKLYEIAEECGDDVPIPINSVRGVIFKKILDFVYAVKISDIENQDMATELLVAANRFDCTHLKLFVESVLVDNFLTAENAAELFVLADSHSCALLKEAATNLFATDPVTVKNGKAWSEIRESTRLMDELLSALVYATNPEAKKRKRETYDHLDVGTLRKKLEEANLDLDGGREVLVARLKAHREGNIA
jgi:hypothetical protein